MILLTDGTPVQHANTRGTDLSRVCEAALPSGQYPMHWLLRHQTIRGEAEDDLTLLVCPPSCALDLIGWYKGYIHGLLAIMLL